MSLIGSWVRYVDIADDVLSAMRAHGGTGSKLALNAGWDLEMLSLEIGELGEAGFDLNRREIAAGF